MSRLLTLSIASALLVGTGHAALAANSCTLTFKSKTLATGTGTQGVATGDFNRDGNLDFVVTNGEADTVSVFLGNGDGTFQPKADFATGSGPDAVAVGDVNGDGIPDLVTSNAFTVSVLLGNGDGTFQANTDYSLQHSPDGVVLADFNGDHMPDIAVSLVDDGNNGLGVLLNKGDGTFGTMTSYATNGGVHGSPAAADFNGDGRTDIAVAMGDRVGVLLGHGDGTFELYKHYPTGGTQARAVVALDLNADKNIDLVTANQNDGKGGSVSVLLGNGDGTFAAPSVYAVGTGLMAMATGKITGDQYVDLAVANTSGDYLMSVLPGNGDGTFGTAQNFGTGEYPLGIATGVFHGQKKTKDDVVVGDDQNSGGITFFRNNGCR